MRYWILFGITLLGANALIAQATPDSLRAFYIEEYPDKFSAWPVVKHRSLTFEVSDRKHPNQTVAFRPNNNSGAGFGFYIFEVVLEVAFTLPINERQKQIFGETKSRDFQVNALGKSWGMDLYYQKYSGFYRDDSRVKGIIDPPTRPDIKTKNFGVSGFYVLNNRKFSLQSSYNYAERQIRNRGSFIVYGTINSFKSESDSAMLSQTMQDGFGMGADFEDLKCTTLSIAPGYSYNLILKKIFLNGTITVGPAHHWVYYQQDNGDEHYDVSFNATYSLRLAVGYNSDRIFGGVGFVVQSRAVAFEDIEFENTTSTARILIGYRFAEKGILKKRVWDFLPFLKGS